MTMIEDYGAMTVSEFGNLARKLGVEPAELLRQYGQRRAASEPGD